MQFDLWLNLADSCMTFDPSNAFHFGQGFFLPSLVAIGLLSNLISGWPQHDFWQQQCITLWPGVLPIKFGSHRAFLRNLTSVNPSDFCMIFDPSNALHFGQGFFLLNLVATGHFKAIWPLVDLWMTFGRVTLTLNHIDSALWGTNADTPWKFQIHVTFPGWVLLRNRNRDRHTWESRINI